MFLLAISPGEGFEAHCWSRVIHSGVDALMIREGQMEPKALLALARWVRCERPDLEVWVKGRLDVALAAGCGLHAQERYPAVPPALLPLSRPLHYASQFPDRSEARQLLVSPIFPVPGKGSGMGREGLHALLDALPPFSGRILALGGIQASRLEGLRHSNLAGVAVIRALWATSDPSAEVQCMRDAWER